MNGFNICLTLDKVIPVTSRRIIVPEGITFKQLHEIIQLLFGFSNRQKYKFTFEYFSLELMELNSINPDYINATREPIDKYFQAFTKAQYLYDFKNKWSITLDIDEVRYEKKYPEFLGFHGRYNPFDACIDKKNFMMILDMKKNPEKYEDLNDYVEWINHLTYLNKNNVQESLMKMFDVPFKRVGHKIVEVKIDSDNSLDAYF